MSKILFGAFIQMFITLMAITPQLGYAQQRENMSKCDSSVARVAYENFVARLARWKLDESDVEGLYYRHTKPSFYSDGSYKAIRFFKDGAVVAISVSAESVSALDEGEPDGEREHGVYSLSEMMEMLAISMTPGQEQMSNGTYQMKDKLISFSVSRGRGSVDYWGRFDGPNLIINSISRINGYCDQRVFSKYSKGAE